MNARKIPLPKYLFEQIYAAYDLRCYCGENENNQFGPEYLPGTFTNVAAGETIQLFAPGKKTKTRALKAEVISPDPIHIRIIKQL